MKLIAILAVLLVIAYLLKTQLGSESSSNKIDALLEQQKIEAPKVPSTPKDLKKFENELNDFVLDSADKRKQEFEEALDN